MPVIHSSGSNNYGTPRVEVFDPLDSIFHFNIDLAANKRNHKVKPYFTRNDDSLEKGWTGYRGWLNPPYNDPTYRVEQWVRKAILETRKSFETLVVMLVKNDPSTKWSRLAWGHADIVTLWRDRIQFEGAKTGAVFTNSVFVFGSNKFWEHRDLEDHCEMLSDYGIAINLHGKAVWLPEGCEL